MDDVTADRAQAALHLEVVIEHLDGSLLRLAPHEAGVLRAFTAAPNTNGEYWRRRAFIDTINSLRDARKHAQTALDWLGR